MTARLFLGPLNRLLVFEKRFNETHALGGNYPTGLPESTTGLFRLEDLVDGAIQILGGLQEPSFAYLHFYPPHGLYHPTADFAEAFNDGWAPVGKPLHPIAYEKQTNEFLSAARRLYNQYMASWDHEVSRLFDYLSSSGLLDRSYVVLTSDHGELFERGDVGSLDPHAVRPHHAYPLDDQGARSDRATWMCAFPRAALTSSRRWHISPEIRSRTGRRDNCCRASAGAEDPGRSIFTVDAKNNPSWAPLTRTTHLAHEEWAAALLLCISG